VCACCVCLCTLRAGTVFESDSLRVCLSVRLLLVQLLASSGDSGAHGRTDDDCGSKILRPAFPAASPYVTAVGATMIKAGTGVCRERNSIVGWRLSLLLPGAAFAGTAARYALYDHCYRVWFSAGIIGGTAPVCTTTYKDQCVTGGTQIVASTATGALITSGGGFSNGKHKARALLVPHLCRGISCTDSSLLPTGLRLAHRIVSLRCWVFLCPIFRSPRGCVARRSVAPLVVLPVILQLLFARRTKMLL
jgi:hypothetical protein